MERRELPNATAVLVLGILSILTCCCYGAVGLTLGIIALVLAKKDMKIYLENPELYGNYQNLNIGRVLSIIGIVLSSMVLIVVIYTNLFVSEESMNSFMENLRIKAEQQQNQD
jgi:hypothetical protein